MRQVILIWKPCIIIRKKIINSESICIRLKDVKLLREFPISYIISLYK